MGSQSSAGQAKAAFNPLPPALFRGFCPVHHSVLPLSAHLSPGSTVGPDLLVSPPPSLLHPCTCLGPEEAHLGRAVRKAKKPSSHSPSSGQCQQQQQAQDLPVPMAWPGLHLGAHCSQWPLNCNRTKYVRSLLPALQATEQSVCNEQMLLRISNQSHHSSQSQAVIGHCVSVTQFAPGQGPGPALLCSGLLELRERPVARPSLFAALISLFPHMVINSKPQFRYLVVRPCTGHLVILSIRFPIFKMGFVMLSLQFQNLLINSKIIIE